MNLWEAAASALPADEGGSEPDWNTALHAKIEAMVERGRAHIEMQKSREAEKKDEPAVKFAP